MTITHKLSIDLVQRECPVRVDAVQDDCGRALSLMLHTNGIPWSIPVGIKAVVRYCKSDGIGGEYDTLPDGTRAWSAADNVLTVSLAPQVLTVPGEVALSILLTDGVQAVSTFDISLHVQPGIHGRITGSDTYVNVSAPTTQNTTEDALAAIGSMIISGKISSIVLLGDSITDGAGGSDYNGIHSGDTSINTDGYCWANAFKKFVEERYGVSVTNRGMYGTQMVTQKDRALQFVTKKDFVIWLTGTNDRNWYASYQTHFRTYLDAIKDKCSGMLVISNIPSTNADENDHNTNMQKMDEIVRTATEGYVPYFSMYQEFNRYCDVHNINHSACFADHVHPNDLGYYIMFKILCQMLGLPLDPYTNYRYSGSWWAGTGEDNSGDESGGSTDDSGESGGDSGDADNPGSNDPGTLLLDSTDDYSKAPHDSVVLTSTIVPLTLMDGYNGSNKTTELCGKHITKLSLYVNAAGNITIGTVSLNHIGSANPAYVKSKVFPVTKTGFVDFWLNWDVGKNETLAVQSTSDTGRLGFVTQSGDLFIWKSSAFAAGAKDTDLILYGQVYHSATGSEDTGSGGSGGQTDNPGTLLLDGTDDYTGSANDSMVLSPSVVPVVLMTGYDRSSRTTAVSGKYITRAVMRVNLAGPITIGKVDLTTIGHTPVYTEFKTFNITETGDEIEFRLDMDVGTNETLAFQRTTDTGKIGFIVAKGDLQIWQSSEFAAGATSTTIMLWGKIYGN